MIGVFFAHRVSQFVRVLRLGAGERRARADSQNAAKKNRQSSFPRHCKPLLSYRHALQESKFRFIIRLLANRYKVGEDSVDGSRNPQTPAFLDDRSVDDGYLRLSVTADILKHG